MYNGTVKISIGLCETQPATAEGIRCAVNSSHDMECRWGVSKLAVGLQLARQQPTDILLIDKAFGLAPVMSAASEMRAIRPECQLAVWGNSMSEAEALRFLQAGARGLLRKTSDMTTILDCLRAVGRGSTWIEDCVFRENSHGERPFQSGLTTREQQVLQLVEQGLKNKEIASELGIQPGTVKIHLKHIFEKTGVHGRYGLAINGMRQRGLLALRASLEEPIPA